MILNLNHTYDHCPEYAEEVMKHFDVEIMKMETLWKKKTFMIYNKKQLGVTEA